MKLRVRFAGLAVAMIAAAGAARADNANAAGDLLLESPYLMVSVAQ